MTTIRATAQCPMCDWSFSQEFKGEVDALGLVSTANKFVDPLLTEHVKSHDSIASFLVAAGATPDSTASKKFRGTFDLRYQEVTNDQGEK